MPIILGNLFSPAELAVLQKLAAGLHFEDGAATAGQVARRVKNNEQAAPSKDRDALLKKVQAALMAHPVFRTAARPKTFVQLLVSRYGPGQSYGLHVDDALMGGGRTDLSFTLFLSEPDSYDGGALLISDRMEDRRIRLEPGEAALYPSDTLHRVEPITRGTRLAIVGWVTSVIRDKRQREILFDIDTAISEAEAAGQDAILMPLLKTRSNLLRMWAE